MIVLDPVALLDAWELPVSRALRPAAFGLNNRTYFVETPAGVYVLRVYQNTGDVARVRYEHAVLERVRRARLPFAVPRPLPARSGDTLARLAGPERELLAALFPLIPGRRPEPGSVTQARAAGAALGELDEALRLIDDVRPVARVPAYGDLPSLHPRVGDPLTLPTNLPLPTEARARLRALLASLVAAAGALYQSLPQQLIHGDLGLGNALVDQTERVSGILDFEFAAPDVRAMDLAVGLYHFAAGSWGSGAEWELLDAFGRAYAARVRLTPAEVANLPALLRLRTAASLVHWAGRRRDGLAAERDVLARAAAALQLDAWLALHADAFVSRARSWLR